MSQIKPPIIKLPFLFFKGCEEVEAFADSIQSKIAEFTVLKREKERTLEETASKMKPFWAERLFSEWVCERYLEEQR